VSATDEILDILCMDCGVEVAAIGHWFMLLDRVWGEAVPDGKGVLCLDCTERRLGRPLRDEDFIFTCEELKWRGEELRHLARLGPDYGDFERRFERHFPRHGQLSFDFDAGD
jgi:hypothetical protein